MMILSSSTLGQSFLESTFVLDFVILNHRSVFVLFCFPEVTHHSFTLPSGKLIIHRIVWKLPDTFTTASEQRGSSRQPSSCTCTHALNCLGRPHLDCHVRKPRQGPDPFFPLCPVTLCDAEDPACAVVENDLEVWAGVVFSGHGGKTTIWLWHL